MLLGAPPRELVGLINEDDVVGTAFLDQLRRGRHDEAVVVLHAEDVKDFPSSPFPIRLHDDADRRVFPRAEDARHHVRQQDGLARAGIAIDDVTLIGLGDDLADEVVLLRRELF